MASRRLSKLPIRDLVQTLSAGGPAAVKLAPTVKAVDIHYQPNQAGQTVFMHSYLGHLVNANPNIAWTARILPSIKNGTKDPARLKAFETFSAEQKASGSKIQQKIVIQFESGESKTVPFHQGNKNHSKSILDEFLEAAGTASISSSITPKSLPYSDPTSTPSLRLTGLGSPPSATQTSSPAANAIAIEQADETAAQASLPRPSSLSSEQAAPTGSEEDVRADQDTESAEAKEVQRMVEAAKSNV